MPLRQVPAPEPQPGQVIVDVKAVGICGSDVHGFTGSTGRRQPPMVMGHEFSGLVSAVGPDAGRFRPGDRVIGNPILACGHCANCQAGRPNICSQRHVLGVDLNGAYADQVALAESMVFPMPAGLSWEEAALSEPLAVVLHAANRSPLAPGATVAIVGAGTIGLLTMLAARLGGASQVMVTDLSPHRLAAASRLGADVAVHAGEQDPLAAVLDLTGGRGADVVLEAVGSSATVQQALALVRSGGHVTWIGNSQPQVQLSMQSVVTREITIAGTYGFSGEFGQAIDLLATRAINATPLIEARIGLEQGPEMIRRLAAGEVDLVKAIIEP
jgi:L-iditol 2-dehydrogenase